MSAAAAVLPFLQARAEFVPILRRARRAAILRRVQRAATLRREPQPAVLNRVQAQHEAPASRLSPRPQIAFYRKYTEGMLRRYTRMSLEIGRVPSLLGRGEMFRAKVSSYRMESFEDIVIFCHDVERCISRLSADEQFVVDRMAIRQYTANETAEMLDLEARSVIRRYCRAVDRLTAIFLEVKLLDLRKCCQAPRTVENAPSDCNQDNYTFHFDGS